MSRRLRLNVCVAAIAGLATAPPIALEQAPPAWREVMPLVLEAHAAQETMTFEEVSPESAATIERRRRDRQSRTDAIPETPPTPDAPLPPAPVSRAGDVVRIGSDIHIEENQIVEGDVFALRGDIEVDGHVKGNVAATGGDVRLGPTARVDGDVMCIGGTLTEDPGAVVGGQKVTALRGRERIRDRIRDRIDERIRGEGDHDKGGFGFVISWLLLTSVVAWLLARFAPDRTRVAFDTLRNDVGASLMMGFLIVLLLIPSVVALALAIGVLCITIIGIPLAIMLIPAYGLGVSLLFLWGFSVGATAIGGRFVDRINRPKTLANSALAGAVVVSGMLFAAHVLHYIPFFGWIGGLIWVLGWVTFGFATLAGAGALLKSKFGQGPGGQWWPPFRRKAPTAPGAPPAPAMPGAPATAPGSPASATAYAPPPPPAAGWPTAPAPPPTEPPAS